jgi:hypothetical protein
MKLKIINGFNERLQNEFSKISVNDEWKNVIMEFLNLSQRSDVPNRGIINYFHFEVKPLIWNIDDDELNVFGDMKVTFKIKYNDISSMLLARKRYGKFLDFSMFSPESFGKIVPSVEIPFEDIPSSAPSLGAWCTKLYRTKTDAMVNRLVIPKGTYWGLTWNTFWNFFCGSHSPFWILYSNVFEVKKLL